VAKAKRLTQAYVLRRLDETWDEVLTSCFGLTQTAAQGQLRQLLRSSDDGSDNHGQLFKAALDLALGKEGRDAFRKQAQQIQTEADLARAIARIRETADVIPSVTRKATKMLVSALPRRGGPGRRRKLTATEAARACDHIGTFMRQGGSLTVALRKAAEASETLIGKKVSARTLQKAWKDRGTLPSQ
jgi:hypothetical protein